MLLVCNLSQNKTLKINRDDIKIIDVDYDDTNSLYRNIGKAGISIEKEILENGGIWSNDFKYKSVILIWDDLNLDLNDIILNSIDFRGDEIMFDDFKKSFEFNWVIGHPCSIIMWSSSIMNCETITVPLNIDGHRTKIKDKKLLWMAHRIGLKIYGK